MMLLRSFQVISIVTFAMLMPVLIQAESPVDVGIWSKEARFLSYVQQTRKVQIAAPDKNKVVVIDGVRLLVVMGGKELPGIENEGVGTLAELSWAPDSSAFFITWSDGGTVGTWRPSVYLIRKTRVHRVDVTKEIETHFGKQYACKEPEEPNIGAIKWLKGSKNLLLVAEVPPHSTCPEMGKVMGYIVSVPSGKIVEQFGSDKLKTVWGRYLGPRLSWEEKEDPK